MMTLGIAIFCALFLILIAALVAVCFWMIGGESDPESDAGVNACCSVCGRHVCGPKTGEPQPRVVCASCWRDKA